MKQLLLLLLLAISTPVWTQVLTFTKEGKLNTASIDYPTCLRGNTLTFDLTHVERPPSTFIDSLNHFRAQLTSLQAGLPTTIRTNSIDLGAGSALDVNLTRVLADVARRSAANGWVTFDYDSSAPYLPLLLAPDQWPIIRSSTHPAAVINSSGTANVTLPSSNDLFQYDLMRRDNDKQIVSEHLKNSYPYYKGIPASYQPFLAEAARQYRLHGPIIRQLLTQDTINALPGTLPTLPYNQQVIDELVGLNIIPKQLLRIEQQVLTNNDEWLKRWLWYTGGNIRLNPFIVFDPAPALQTTDTELRILNEQLTASRTAFSTPDPDEKARLVANITRLENRRDQLAALKDPYAEWLRLHSVDKELLYKGQWHTSSDETINWLRHFDAGNAFKSLTEPKSLPDMVFLNDYVYAYTHNVAGGDKLTLTASRADFTPETKLALSLKDINAQFSLASKSTALGLIGLVGSLIPKQTKAAVDAQRESAFDSETDRVSMMAGQGGGNRLTVSSELDVISLLRPMRSATVSLTNKSAVLNSLENTINSKLAVRPLAEADATQLLDALNYVMTLRKSDNDALFLRFIDVAYNVQDGQGYQIVVDQFKKSQAALDWLLTQTEPPSSLPIKAQKTPLFKTVANQTGEKLELTKSSTVTFQGFSNGGDKAVFSGTFNTYKPARVMPTIGVAYIPVTRSATEFDEATGQFKTGKTFSNIEALVGVKWYVARPTNPARDIPTRHLIRRQINPTACWFTGAKANRLRGNSFWNTLFLTAGLGVKQDFLRNYYVGAGVDLVPGVSLHAGSNFIFRNYYTLENGKILNQQERPKGYLYVSLSFDPAIAGELVKLFTAAK